MQWSVRLARQAEQDFGEILQWTAANLGPQQAQIYAETLAQALDPLGDGPEVPGARQREEIARGIRTLHVARQGRKGRHSVVFRTVNGRFVDVLGLLHDSMDLSRHVPSSEDEKR